MILLDDDRDRLRLALTREALSVEHMLCRVYERERDQALKDLHEAAQARDAAEGRLAEITNALAAWETNLIGKRELIDTIERTLA